MIIGSFLRVGSSFNQSSTNMTLTKTIQKIKRKVLNSVSYSYTAKEMRREVLDDSYGSDAMEAASVAKRLVEKR